MCRYHLILYCLFLITLGCKDTATSPEGEMLYSPVGVAIMAADSIVMQYRGGEEISGQLITKTGTYSPKYSFRLIDVSGGFVTPSEETYTLQARVEINDIADAWVEGFDFYIKGKLPGRTNVILRVVTKSAVLYTSKPLPTVVTE